MSKYIGQTTSDSFVETRTSLQAGLDLSQPGEMAQAVSSLLSLASVQYARDALARLRSLRGSYQVTPLSPEKEQLLSGLTSKSPKADLTLGIAVLASSLWARGVESRNPDDMGAHVSFSELFPVISPPAGSEPSQGKFPRLFFPSLRLGARPLSPSWWCLTPLPSQLGLPQLTLLKSRLLVALALPPKPGWLNTPRNLESLEPRLPLLPLLIMARVNTAVAPCAPELPASHVSSFFRKLLLFFLLFGLERLF
jgi:hypothetical protein